MYADNNNLIGSYRILIRSYRIFRVCLTGSWQDVTGFLEYILRIGSYRSFRVLYVLQDPDRILQEFQSTSYRILIGSYRIYRVYLTGFQYDLTVFLEYILQDSDRILQDFQSTSYRIQIGSYRIFRVHLPGS